MIHHHHTTWGHYAVYMTWLHRHHPAKGIEVFHYLKENYPDRMYSFWYLLGLYTINALYRCVTRRLPHRQGEA